MACFGHVPQADSKCRFLEKRHCEAGDGCLWADPASHRCVGEQEFEACATLGYMTCSKSPGCSWDRPLDLRAACRNPSSPHAGARCDAVLAKQPGALDAVRAAMRVPLMQVFGFGVANMWLVSYFGSIEQVMMHGKPFVVGVFALVAGAGSLHRTYDRS